MPKTDPQRDALYWLESEFNGWWGLVKMSRSAALFLTASVCKYYSIPLPTVKISRKTSAVEGDYLHGVITLYSGKGDNPGILLHELAHHVTDELMENIEPHGPEFVAIYMHLLDRWNFISNEEFRRLAKKYKVKIGRRYRPRAFR